MTSRARGFTLIELMIVVAIIGIIAMVGFPAYQDSVMKSRRAEAKSRMLQIAQLQERNFTQSNTYTLNIAGLLGVTAPVYSSDSNAVDSGYQITAAAAAGSDIAQSFVLTATRQAGMSNDTECGDLVLLHTGQKQITGIPAPTGTVAKCWG